MEGHTLNRDDAETVRNFEYGGKIKRIYVTAEQLTALLAAEPAERLPFGPGVDVQQRLHQRLADGTAGGDDRDAVAEPGGAHHDELAGAVQCSSESLALSFEGRGAELDDGQEHQGEATVLPLWPSEECGL